MFFGDLISCSIFFQDKGQEPLLKAEKILGDTMMEGLGIRGRGLAHALFDLDYINNAKVLTCVVRRHPP